MTRPVAGGGGARPTVVGIDVGGTKILARATPVGDPGAAVAVARVDTPSGEDALVAALIEVTTRIDAELAGAGSGPALAVGLGVAGQIDLGGRIRYAPNLPGIVEADLAGPLAARLGRPVVVDNDANCAALAEHRLGAARGAAHAVVVTLGTGIGAGVVVDGQLLRGAAGFAGEPGHMMIDPAGPPCPCGRRGCWERFASGSGLGRLGRDAAAAGRAEHLVALAGGDAEAVRGEHVVWAVRDGDADAIEVLRSFAWWVAVGIANLVDILDTEIVVIGGGLVEAGDVLFEPMREAYQGLVLAADHRPEVPIVPAALGPDSGAIGAAVLAGDQVRRPGRRGGGTGAGPAEGER